jgi:iron(III) transport system permease protein
VSTLQEDLEKEPRSEVSTGAPGDRLVLASARRRNWIRRNLLTPEAPLFGVGILVATFILFLTAVALWTTFVEGIPRFGAELTLSNYTEAISSPLFRASLKNTAIVGVGTVAVSLAIALPIAWLVQRTNLPARRLVIILMFLPVLLPGFLKIMGYIMLLSPDVGILNQALRTVIDVDRGPLSIYGIVPIFILQGMSISTTAFLLTAGAFRSIDPSMEEAAEIGGANRFQTFRRVTLPVILPAIVAAAIYNFMTAVSMFETAALLGMSRNIWVLSTAMYASIYETEGLPRHGIAAVYGVFLMLPALFALSYYQRMTRRAHRFATVTGKGFRPKVVDLGRWRWVAFGGVGLFFALEFVFPLLAVLYTSLLPSLQMPSAEAFASFGLDAYRNAVGLLTGGPVLTNTLVLIGSVGIAVVFVSVVMSWIVLRTRMPGRGLLDTTSMLPHALPSSVLAFSVLISGLLIARITPALYGTVVAIIIAHTIMRIPFGTRAISGSLIQIHSELEQAGEVSGASRVAVIRRILVPLVLPAVFFTLIWSVLHSFSEVTVALFLMTPRNMVVSTAIWDRWTSGDIVTAAATGILMTGVMSIVILLAMRFFPRIFGTSLEI